MINEELKLARETRDYTTIGPLLAQITYEEFIAEGFIAQLKNINGFEFGAALSGLGSWKDIVDSGRVALRLHEAVQQAIRQARFHNVSALQTYVESERLTFRFGDADFGFDLEFRGNGRVLLSRAGSTMRTFHRWYTGLMPHIPDILRKAVAALNAEFHYALEGGDSSTPADEIPDRVRILSARFGFDVVCYNFHQTQQSNRKPKKVINLDVMGDNIAIALPDEDGRILRKDANPSWKAPSHDERPGAVYGRMDYKVSLQHRKVPCVAQVMGVSAPSNSQWSGLFFTLIYSGTTVAETPEGEREELPADFFLHPAACADAYISFFRDMGAEGFINSVTSGYEFETTAGGLA